MPMKAAQSLTDETGRQKHELGGADGAVASFIIAGFCGPRRVRQGMHLQQCMGTDARNLTSSDWLSCAVASVGSLWGFKGSLTEASIARSSAHASLGLNGKASKWCPVHFEM